METMAPPDEKIDALDTRVHALDQKVGAGFARIDQRIEVESVRTDQRFERVGERFDEVERRSDERFTEVARRFDVVERDMAGIKASLSHIDDKLDAFNRSFTQVCGGLIGTLIVALVTVLSTH